MSEQENPIAVALATLKQVMQNDPEYAWGWHCNIAVPIMDAIDVSHERANLAAAYLMSCLFDYDITKHKHYDYGKTDAQQYHEMRLEMDRQEDAEIAARTAQTGADHG